MIVNMQSILKDAREKAYGIAAPNICNEITARAAIEVANENKAPIILDLVFTSNPNIAILTKMIHEMAKEVKIPVALNLDYCKSYEYALQALSIGFTSVSLDCTDKTMAQNIKETCDIVEAAHALNAGVEAQLGKVVSGDEFEKQGEANYTDVNVVKSYVEKTKIDALSIAVGTARGFYKGSVNIDFDRIKKINDEAKIPLSLHGGSFTGVDNLKKAISLGVSKINLSTELFTAANDYAFANRNNLLRPDDIFKLYSDGYKERLAYYMKAFGQCDRV